MLRLAGRQPLPVVIMVGSAGGLVVIALWLWMARANSQGRNWDEDSLAAAERQFVRHGAECDAGVVGSDVASSVSCGCRILLLPHRSILVGWDSKPTKGGPGRARRRRS